MNDISSAVLIGLSRGVQGPKLRSRSVPLGQRDYVTWRQSVD